MKVRYSYLKQQFSNCPELWSDLKPTNVIHLGAKVGGIVENLNYPADFYEINTIMNTNVLTVSNKHNVTRFTGILSTCMYPDVVETYPMTEDNIHDGPPSFANFNLLLGDIYFTFSILELVIALSKIPLIK